MELLKTVNKGLCLMIMEIYYKRLGDNMRVKPSRRFTTLVKKKAVDKGLNVRTLALAVNINIERLEQLLDENMQSLKNG